MKYFSRVHYPFATFWIIIGMFLAYIAFYYGNRMTMTLYLEEKDTDASKIYEYEYPFRCTYNCPWNAVEACFHNVQGNLLISGMPLYLDKADAEFMTSIILRQTEADIPYQFTEGDMPEKQKIPDSVLCAVLGKDRKKYVEQINGKDYICICGEEYLVTGYICAKHSAIYDNATFLFGNRLGNRTQEAVDYYASTWGADFVLQSDNVDGKEEYKKISPILAENGVRATPMTEFDPWFSSEVESANYRVYAYLTYLFSVCMVIMVVEFWIIQRRTEIAIRRLDGFSSIQIIGMIAKEIMNILLLTSSVIFAAQILLNFINGEDFTTVKSVVQLTAVLLFILITFILLMIYPFVKIMKGSIVDVVKEGRRIE